jgi:hypothetical protein
VTGYRLLGGPQTQHTLLEPRIDRLALHREHRERALVDAAERLAVDEALQSLDPKCESPQREGSLDQNGEQARLVTAQLFEVSMRWVCVSR